MRGYKQFPKSQLGAGVGLKPQHYSQVLGTNITVPSQEQLWFEVHSENYFSPGGPRLEYLEKIREKFPLSFHGIGASLGNPYPKDEDHLKNIKRLVKQFQPTLISEHAVWSKFEKSFFSELLPLMRTKQMLNMLIEGINVYQDNINRTILIENPTNYLNFKSELDEPEFLVEAATRSGCGLLVDINNLYLSGQNCGFNCSEYLEKIPPELVGEIHIAGYDADPSLGEKLLIDSHANSVSEPVWDLLDKALNLFGEKPILLERDDNIPSYSDLMEERNRAQKSLTCNKDNNNDKIMSAAL